MIFTFRPPEDGPGGVADVLGGVLEQRRSARRRAGRAARRSPAAPLLREHRLLRLEHELRAVRVELADGRRDALLVGARVSPPRRSKTMTVGASSPPGYCSIAFSALIDSASPGRNEDDSFFCASSNLPDSAGDGIETSRKTAKTTHFARRPAGMREETAHRRPASTRGTVVPRQCRSSSGSVTGRWQAKRSHTYAAARPSTGSRPSSSGTSPVAAGEHEVRAELARARRARARPCPGPRAPPRGPARAGSRSPAAGARTRSGAAARSCAAAAIVAERRLLVARLAGERGEPQQPERGGRAAGRDRRVLELLAAGDQRLVVGGGGEEAAALGVGEALEDLVGERARLGEPARRRRSPRRASAAPRAGTRGPRGRRRACARPRL